MAFATSVGLRSSAEDFPQRVLRKDFSSDLVVARS